MFENWPHTIDVGFCSSLQPCLVPKNILTMCNSASFFFDGVDRTRRARRRHDSTLSHDIFPSNFAKDSHNTMKSDRPPDKFIWLRAAYARALSAKSEYSSRKHGKLNFHRFHTHHTLFVIISDKNLLYSSLSMTPIIF